MRPGHYSPSTMVLAYPGNGDIGPGSVSAFFGVEQPFQPTSVTVTFSNAGGYVLELPTAAIGVSTAGGLYSDPGTGDTVGFEIRNTTDRTVRIGSMAAVFRGTDGRVTNIATSMPDIVLAPGGVYQNIIGAPPTGKLAASASVDLLSAWFPDEPSGTVVSWQTWFTDISTQPLRMSIAWLAEHGITGGCSTFRYCPTAQVTRAQMAIFLVRAFGYPAAAGDHFSDDDGKTGESSINALYEAGITGGCAPGRFCPTASVTRAQMALFLDRAIDPPLPATSVDYFDDDDGKTGEAAINRLAAAGITGGCGPRRFCPTASVTRAQMAAFLQRALTYTP